MATTIAPSVPTSADTTLRELDCRSNDGLQVRLLYSAADGSTYLELTDVKGSGMPETYAVAGSSALDAFRHPYRYVS